MDATTKNEEVISKRERQGNQDYAPFGPTLRKYKSGTSENEHPRELISNLTGYLLAAFDETKSLITSEMEDRHSKRDSSYVQSAISNSLKRSAGTNYQALVSYALARYLLQKNSAWFVEPSTPSQLKDDLSIDFKPEGSIHDRRTDGSNSSQGTDDQKDEGLPEVSEEKPPYPEEQDESDISEAEKELGELIEEDSDSNGDDESLVFQVEPDMDIILRNQQAVDKSMRPEPIILLSVKTSLVDRGGQAARWKLYFDLVSNPCPLQEKENCMYDKIGMKMNDAGKYDIRQGLVTANIYKIKYSDERYHSGELASGQTRSNTYMFDLKLSTRNDETSVTPHDWDHFTEIEKEIRLISNNYDLPLSKEDVGQQDLDFSE
ncbi:hypothetical protein GGP86_003112 [Salinibacter ruber]|uniref:hypothetical protein n=1 Tax=Salinibacter ruber TaxID=146919 RepID=UPI002167554F|nr:hypothetical protein [Salinibacter ruber]MCS3863316.1 hypothetical protein [Salinibacter ruber]